MHGYGKGVFQLVERGEIIDHVTVLKKHLYLLVRGGNIFDTAISKFNVDPSLTAFIDDKPENVDAGQKAGLYAYRGDMDGRTYYFTQFYLQTSIKIFCFTVASTEPIDVKEGDVADIIGSIRF